jgi:hypothetical protein
MSSKTHGQKVSKANSPSCSLEVLARDLPGLMRKVNAVGPQKSIEEDTHAGQGFRRLLCSLHLGDSPAVAVR